MNRFDLDWSVPLRVKCRKTCLRESLRELENLYRSAHQTVFSVVGCNSDSEIMAALVAPVAQRYLVTL